MAVLYPILVLYSVVAAMCVFLISDPKIRAWIAGPRSKTARPESALEGVPPYQEGLALQATPSQENTLTP